MPFKTQCWEHDREEELIHVISREIEMNKAKAEADKIELTERRKREDALATEREAIVSKERIDVTRRLWHEKNKWNLAKKAFNDKKHKEEEEDGKKEELLQELLAAEQRVEEATKDVAEFDSRARPLATSSLSPIAEE